MIIDIITLFPAMFRGPFEESIIKRAQEKGLIKIRIHNLRRWAIDKRGTVDDRPFGGGEGMVLRPEPIFNAVEELKGQKKNGKIILLTPQGTIFKQEKAEELAKLEQLILICGHYEGVDERVREHLVDEEISIGDYVLTGGELPAMVVIDATVRLIPGVLGKRESLKEESFGLEYEEKRLLEYPQYTRPANFRGLKVPKILLSGNHQEIRRWRLEQSLRRTRERRPDLLMV